MQTQAIMDKYFKADGNFTEAGQAAYDKMKPVLDQLDKLGKSVSKYGLANIIIGYFSEHQ